MDKVTPETQEQRLAGIRERESKAAEGPFHVEHNEIRNEYDELIADVEYEGDAHFFAHARADIPYLLSALDSESERVLLEAAKAICDGYGKDAIVLQVDGGFFHLANGQYVCCEAAAIHDLRSKGESR